MFTLKAALTACAVLASSCVVSTGARAGNFIYDVTIKTHDGKYFKDCWTINGLQLTISSLGTFPITAAPSMPHYYYTGVINMKDANNLGQAVAFTGFKHGGATSGELRAVGSSTAHDSYDVHGVPVSACGADHRGATSSDYLHTVH